VGTPEKSITEYIVTVVSPEGCVDTSSVSFEVRLRILIPNVFSPNDDGVNDEWIIEGLDSYPNAKIQIFNRWGNKVYEQIGYAKPWDGKRNGSKLPIATYYYVIDLSDGDETDPITGSITILTK
jgi:gliding motility-associated-like protein